MAIDNSSISQTCPLIDDVIDFLDYVHEIDDKDEILAQVDVFKNTMEQIRTANESLRNWGNEQYSKREHLESELNDKQTEVDALKYQVENQLIKKDRNGKPIHKGDKFKFKLMKELHEHIELIGSFDWNDEELRYEIDIWDNDEYVCLSYVCNGVMYGFELLP